MELSEEFEWYLEPVSEWLGRSERKAGLKKYCGGLMLPLKRKSLDTHRVIRKAPWNAPMDPLAGVAIYDPEHD